MTEKDHYIRRDFLAQHGERLLDNGYTIVPIQQGKKAPGFDGWQKVKPSRDQWKAWLQEGFKHAGVGILTRLTCAADIDCMDEAAALHFEELIRERVGKAPVRIGKAPKRLMLFRTSEPFRKRRTTVYRDEWEDKQMIEFLGDGQQFVAFHIHPDTGKPYHWINDVSPLNVRAADLPELKPDDIDFVIARFEEYAKAQGWAVEKKARDGMPGNLSADDAMWAEDTKPIDIKIEELRNTLMLIPVDEGGYDQWFQVGMALHHQFDGDREGFDLWVEWSEQSMHYDLDELERKWPTFEIEGKKRAPLTARFILRLAKESAVATALEVATKLRDAFLSAKDLADWEKAREMTRVAEIDGLARSALAAVAKDRRDAITGSKTPLGEIKKAISYLPKKAEQTPSWAAPWVYDVSDDKFFHTEKKIAASQQGFNAMYDRQAMTKKDILDGKTGPTQTASALALNLFRIPTVDGRRYMPGRDAIFHDPDGTFTNTYPEHEIPAAPEKELPRDKKNIERVKAHIAHLLPDPVEQRHLIDWLSWVAQNPGRHANYAVLIQGVEGDGKSFFAEMMRAVMGVSNVTMLNANIVNSDFTDWVYGQCLACFEEVRIVGHKGADKWDIINKVKTFITNNVIEVHPKGGKVFNAINTTSYMLFSNYKDALPIDDNSRRYLILFSRWQNREALKAFIDENPEYFDRLYATLTESAGALRQWLLKHEQHEDFKPLGNAPATKARSVMIRKAKHEFIQMLDDIIAEDVCVEATRDLVDITGLADVMVMRGVDWPSPKTLVSLLERDGYESLGRVRLSQDAVHVFYSKRPEKFIYGEGDDTKVDATKVRRYIEARRAALEDDDL